MNEMRARSTVGGHLFLGNKTSNNKTICLNGDIHILQKMLYKIVASAAEAKIGGLFLKT